MTELKPYDSIGVSLLRSTDNPKEILNYAIGMTMRKDFRDDAKSFDAMIPRLLTMNHTSVFEHINYTYLIEGASRNFLAQITRHRIASYTSGSQHYQDYSGYDLSAELDSPEVRDLVDRAVKLYDDLLKQGVAKEEARQILPGGMQNNLLVTMDMRSLTNFFNLRLCERNVKEMRVVAGKMFDLAYDTLPEYWRNIGPDCYMTNCNQGKMRCKGGYIRKINGGKQDGKRDEEHRSDAEEMREV